MRHIVPIGCAVLFTVAAYAAEDITCEGQYGGHLQGIATDDAGAIYWSFTVDIVKTDAEGRLLAHVEAPDHQGDLTVTGGRVYVAVNLGAFNEEAGQADSWVYVYDGGTLELLDTHPVPEAVHGAGGIAHADGRFYVVGGLPPGHDVNYVYEYDAQFQFIARHTIPSGYTRLGIQTACHALGRFFFGCYGYPENSALLITGSTFTGCEHHDTHTNVGIAHLGNGRFLQGFTGKDPATNRWWGKARPIRFDPNAKGRFTRE